MPRQIADLPELGGLADVRRLVNDRLRRIEALVDSGAGGVSIEQVNALIAGLRSQVQAAVATVTGGTSSVVSVTGGQVVLPVPGTVAIESNASTLVNYAEARTVSQIELLAKQAPIGGNLEVRVLVDGTTVATVTLAAGQTNVRSSVSFSIGAQKQVRVDITSVGITFPGADLSVILRFAQSSSS